MAQNASIFTSTGTLEFCCFVWVGGEASSRSLSLSKGKRLFKNGAAEKNICTEAWANKRQLKISNK